MSAVVSTLNANRSRLITSLKDLKGVGRIGGSHTNFLLVEIMDERGKPSNKRANELYKTLAESRGVVVRFRGNEIGCEGCLRVTVGTEEECDIAVREIKHVLEQI